MLAVAARWRPTCACSSWTRPRWVSHRGTVHQQFRTIRQRNPEHGATLLPVEQNANMALALADRGYVLQNGEVALAGPAKVLLRNEQMRLAYLT